MNSIAIEYKQRVYLFLDKMKPGERYKVSILAAPENRKKFIECVKEFMRSFPYNAWISFNHDFSELYKSTSVPIEQLRKTEKERG